ncbi:MAG: hypothetical protein ABIQ16_16585 [Polyangiaceae bacterium]
MTPNSTETAMISYHNDPSVKALYVSRFAAHRAADEVIQGLGYDNGRGCFVGCTLNAYNHSRFPIELGWPEWLAYLADEIFEGIPKDEAPQFGTDLLEAVPVGVNLEPIRFRFLLTVQRRNLARVTGYEPYAVQVRAAIEQVCKYLENPDEESAAARSARSAARSAWSAAGSAESAAEYRTQRDDLLAMLRECGGV